MSESDSASFPHACTGCHGVPSTMLEDRDGRRPSPSPLERRVPCTPPARDSEPAFGFTPVGEQVFPPNYDALGIDPCNRPPDLENFAGSALGLDNDGDGYYDGDDLDGDAPQPRPRCGLGIELSLLLPPLGWLGRRRRRVAV